MKEEMSGGFQEIKTNHDSLSLSMKEEMTKGFQEMKTNHDSSSLAMKEEIKTEFQETKYNDNCRHHTSLFLNILILGFDIIVEKINQWLAAPLPSSNHNTAIKKRQPGTGQWFTQSKEFADWKNGTSSFTWLHGIRKSWNPVEVKR